MNAAGQLRAAAEKQGDVADMLRLLGVPKGAAARLAAGYGKAGKDGDALYRALEAETAGRLPHLAGARPNEAEMDAVASYAPDNTPVRFHMHDATNPVEFHLDSEVVNGNQVFSVMRTVSKSDPAVRSKLSGEYMFGKMLDHFEAHHPSLEILGAWGYETNLGLYKTLKAVRMASHEAASGTRTGEWSYNRGYTVVLSVTESAPGTSVDAVFGKPKT